MRNLDRTDKRILSELQRDGRMTNVELAKRVNLSPTPCLDRVRRLERDAVIQGYRAVLDPDKLAMGLLVFVEIVLDRTTNDVFDRFAERVRALPEVVECQMVAGGFDYLMKLRFADMKSYRAFLGKELATLPGVSQTHTYIAMEEVKRSDQLPIL
ncbi:MAG: Lrp/AsnC ligand binding domain-containing protein [Pseudomonadota bacterium]